MNWSDIAAIVGKTAPLLGTLLGGPAAAAVGGIISAALGVGNSPDAIQQAVAADPQAALKLAQIQADHSLELQRLAVTAEDNRLKAETADYQTEVDDRKSARTREVQSGDRMPAILSVLALVGFFAALAAILSGWAIFPKDYELTMGQLLGTLQTCVVAGFSYYLGSTKSAKESSREKDKILTDTTAKLASK